ncbi:MAG: adenosylcobinamide-GDP ribazoletransferase [Acidobacteria bacterium]|nr:adenosylcobinamide-GDP ribazoletransferase [Acidobacteriota bacterium]
MNLSASLRRSASDLLTAIQFLTRVPVPEQPYATDSLARSVKFFPLVGLLVGCVAAFLNRALTPHLPRLITAFLLVLYFLLITGCLHEDGLSDAADGFGGGTNREQILRIMRDSRIGTYGGAAIALSIIGRLLLLSYLPALQVAQYLIVAHVLCRWTTLPLSYFLPSARTQTTDEYPGQGNRLAKLTTASALVSGTIFSFAVAVFLLRAQAVAPILSAIAITYLTAIYYRKRIGGVTGDCFGATNQLAEIGVYLCGVWIV